LTIASDSAENLTQQNIFLISPAANLVTNETDVDFLWQQLNNVTNYHFQLASPDFSNSSFILEDSRSSDDFVLATLSEGEYQWRVRGENDLSFTLTWNNDETANVDSLFVYPDSLISAPVVQLPLSVSSFTFNNQPGNQFYFWRVKSIDQAGNESSFSALRKFYVIE